MPKIRPRHDDDFFDEGDLFTPSIGSINSFQGVPPEDKPKPRAFAPGFHGANPGPSHEEPVVVVKRKRKPRNVV